MIPIFRNIFGSTISPTYTLPSVFATRQRDLRTSIPLVTVATSENTICSPLRAPGRDNADSFACEGSVCRGKNSKNANPASTLQSEMTLTGLFRDNLQTSMHNTGVRRSRGGQPKREYDIIHHHNGHEVVCEGTAPLNLRCTPD